MKGWMRYRGQEKFSSDKGVVNYLLLFFSSCTDGSSLFESSGRTEVYTGN